VAADRRVVTIRAIAARLITIVVIQPTAATTRPFVRSPITARLPEASITRTRIGGIARGGVQARTGS
jgi:hypothetical protein